MEKIVLISLDLLGNESAATISNIENFMDKVTSNGAGILYFSRDYKKVNELQGKYRFWKDKYKGLVVFGVRNKILENIKKMENKDKSSIVIIGTKDLHFQDAVNNKFLFITPTWMHCEEKAKKYGIKVNSLMQLEQLINTLVNQNTWYSSLQLPDGTKVISLSDARSYPKYAHTVEEREIVNLFRSILKDGKTNMYEIYLYHFLAAMSNDSELFRDINDWACFPPSTSYNIVNCEMYKFKEVVRTMMKGMTPRNDFYKAEPNIFIRHTTSKKSHYTDRSERIAQGCTKHFDTICINPGYTGKLKGRNVCVFDDYLTHGNSFECARNLLRREGVKNIIFVTLGRFPNPYLYQEYQITGNIHMPGYTYSLINKQVVTEFAIREGAKKEVENLYNIFNLDK